MAFDKLLESLTPRSTLGAGTTNGTWVYVGPDKDVRWRLTVGGDLTGTNPTLDVTIEGSLTGSGAANATLATFPQVTQEMVGYVESTSPRPEVPGSLPLNLIHNTTAGGTPYPWVRVHAVVGGTATPLFPITSCDVLKVEPGTVKRSGGQNWDNAVYLA